MRPTIHPHVMTSSLARTDVEVRILAPEAQGGALPLIVLLHGAMSSAQSVDLHASIIGGLWDSGALPPCVVACASTPTEGGFYLDWPGGAAWGAMVADDLPTFVAERHRLDLSRTAVMGASMGGFGALKLVFSHPERYVAAAALAPAVFPGTSAADVPARNRPSVLGELLAALEALPHEQPANRLSQNLEAIREAAPRICLGVGERDEFGLRDGAERLHALLLNAEVSHQYLVVAGGGHMDAGMEQLQEAALEHIGRALVDHAPQSSSS